jgi:hypothetical protein
MRGMEGHAQPGAASEPARFFTVADAGFYPGVVALLNSLRLTGHAQELVVLDAGLARAQRRALGEHATIAELPAGTDRHPVALKAYPAVLGAGGTVVVIDSDMIVAASLEPYLAPAAAGRVCAFPDPPWSRARWFAEWELLFGLAAPPRRQTYVNTGFVAVSTAHRPELLRRWWEVCNRIPRERVFRGEVLSEPFYAGDQDALNAVLMSEVPADALEVLPEYASYRERVVVEDEVTLACSFEGRPQAILHEALRPKVWHPRGWRRLRANAYVRLLPRVLFADDVALRLDPSAVPYWLRPGSGPGAARRVLHGSTRGQDALAKARRAPRRAVREVRRVVARTGAAENA